MADGRTSRAISRNLQMIDNADKSDKSDELEDFEKSLCFVNNKLADLILEDSTELEIDLQNYPDIQQDTLLESKLLDLKVDILQIIQNELKERESDDNKTITDLKTENEFLKSQVSKLTNIVENFSCRETRDDCKCKQTIFSHKRSHDVTSSYEPSMLSEQPGEAIISSIEPIIDTATITSQHQQLQWIRTLHKNKYVNYKKNSRASLKRRLQKLADYGEEQIESKPMSTTEVRFNTTNKSESQSKSPAVSENVTITETETDSEHECDSDLDAEEGSENSHSTNTTENKVLIIGDSILKDIKPDKVQNKLHRKRNIISKCHRGATLNSIKSKVLDAIACENPEVVVLHVGTNDLRTNKTPEEISTTLVDFVLETSKHATICVSGLSHRSDNHHKKALAVNKLLSEKCCERNICFINNDNISKTHLNNSKLHLNAKGTKLLVKNFSLAINKL